MEGGDLGLPRRQRAAAPQGLGHGGGGADGRDGDPDGAGGLPGEARAPTAHTAATTAIAGSGHLIPASGREASGGKFCCAIKFLEPSKEGIL